jgi:hypothetical protein
MRCTPQQARREQMSTLLLGSSNWQRLMTPADVACVEADERDTDVEGFSEMIGGICNQSPAVKLPSIGLTRDDVERWADAASPVQLMAGLLSARPDVRELAATYLRDLWMYKDQPLPAACAKDIDLSFLKVRA